MSKFKKKNNKQELSLLNKRGIALFVAVLITSVALLFSYAISNIAVKELNLTQAGRDSQIAFYASNSGIECALFWDLRNDAFDPIIDSSTIECAEESIDFSGITNGYPGTPKEFEVGPFYLDGSNVNGSCFTIHITKTLVNGGDIKTVTESRGYNTCNAGSSRRLERALRATY